MLWFDPHDVGISLKENNRPKTQQYFDSLIQLSYDANFAFGLVGKEVMVRRRTRYAFYRLIVCISLNGDFDGSINI